MRTAVEVGVLDRIRRSAVRMVAHRKLDRRHDGLYAGGLLFPRNAKKCREAIRAGVIYYCSQAFYPKGITNAWLGNAWGGHLQISPVIARIFFSPNFIQWERCRAEYEQTIEAVLPTHK